MLDATTSLILLIMFNDTTKSPEILQIKAVQCFAEVL
jgi:hypothetical protein